ncbi:hypothetical protein [Arcticibacter sp. MXS-1]|uniref:hypothetical protein n=1 Tax=Arcticibacter sp. MXS-1 TaxID=3341726 RepID=UPI0035A8ABF7
MKINLVSFLDPIKYRGGGEMVTKAIIDVGLERGHDIKVSSVRPNRIDEHSEPDLVFLVDVFNNAHSLASLGAWRAFGSNYLRRAIRRAPFIHLTNAYADVCNLPYLPCSGNSALLCPIKGDSSLLDKLVTKDFSNRCFSANDLVRELYEQSILNIYVSPLHKTISEKVLGLEGRDSFILKPLIDTSRFYNMNLQRDIEYLFVGIIGEAKGFYEMRRRFKGEDIHLIGKVAPGIKLDFGVHHGHVTYDRVPSFMNRAKNFVFLPRWPEPQGRVVVEASLCGCHVIGNENVGALSFPMDLSNARNYQGVEEELWLKIESI